MRNKGLCPCPRCLVPKSNLDQTGTKRDNSFRFKNVRTYLFGCVQIARNAIYKSAAAIAGTVVDRLLKATSSVPTLVKTSRLWCSLLIQLCSRMRLLINLALILISPACSLLICFMNSNWVSGKPFLATWFEFYMQLLLTAVWLLSWIDGKSTSMSLATCKYWPVFDG